MPKGVYDRVHARRVRAERRRARLAVSSAAAPEATPMAPVFSLGAIPQDGGCVAVETQWSITHRGTTEQAPHGRVITTISRHGAGGLTVHQISDEGGTGIYVPAEMLEQLRRCLEAVG